MTAAMPETTASDEQQIRDLIATWMRASKSGDTETVLSLMSEDAVFLRAGQPPMIGRAAFAAASKAVAGKVSFDGVSDIQEIKISGDLAYCWSKLSVVVRPLPAGPERHLSGCTLTVLRKEGGRWRLIRDANMLAPEKDAHA